jgi:hypothetical protein
VGSGQWAVVSGQWSVGSGQWAVNGVGGKALCAPWRSVRPVIRRVEVTSSACHVIRDQGWGEHDSTDIGTRGGDVRRRRRTVRPVIRHAIIEDATVTCHVIRDQGW